jgi:putative DNA primase/helicase
LNTTTIAAISELRSYNQWVTWRLETRGDKRTKVPYNPHNGERAESDNPSTWGTYIEALSLYKQGGFSGLGFMFSTTTGIVGIDLDHCRDDETGQIEQWANEIITLLDSYTEISPSGTGVHIFVKGKLPKGARRKGQIEVYDSGRYFTMTARHLSQTPTTIEERQTQLEAFYSKHLVKTPGKELPLSTNRNNLQDEELLNLAIKAKNGSQFEALWNGDTRSYTSHSEADMAFASMLAFWTGKDIIRMDRLFRASGLYRDKWDRPTGASTYGQQTLEKAIELTHDVYSPRKQTATFALTDTGNAERFAAQHRGKIRHCYTLNQWFIWDGRRWTPDEIGEIERLSKETALSIGNEALNETDDNRRTAILKWAASSQSLRARRAMIELARSEPGIPVKIEDMDKDPDLFNVLNGTIHLPTGELRPHNPEELITKLSPVEYQPDAQCPRWEAFLDSIMLGRKELVQFIQLAVGYSLTAHTDERCLFIEFGCGANGKSTQLETICDLMGDYAFRTPTSTLMAKKSDSIPNDIARLKGARFVFASEAEEGKRLAEATVKDLTSGEAVSARFMRGEWFDFKPVCKIWLGTNHKPEIRGTDPAIWDRIRLIPFDYRIPEEARIPRREMQAIFQEEMPGILRWAVEGAMAWYENGLNTPDEIKQATSGYRSEMDTLIQFIAECCQTGPGLKAQCKILYEKYTEWAEATGEYAVKKRDFEKRLKERGLVTEQGHARVTYWSGIALLYDGELVNEGESKTRITEPQNSLKGKPQNTYTDIHQFTNRQVASANNESTE